MWQKRCKCAVIVAVLIALPSLIFAESVESLMNQGQEMLQRGAYSQAVTAFRQVVASESDNFEAQFNLGFAYLQWGRQSNAIEELKKALKIQPRSSQAWSNLAIAYENMGKSQDAINALNQAVQLDPDNVTARMNLAAMYANADHYKDAAAQYKQVIRIDGSNEDALTNLSKCLITAGQTDEAKGYLRQVLGVNPNNGVAHWELGNIYWKKENNLDKAISEYKVAVSVQPDVEGIYDNLALAYEEQRKTNDAIETWKKKLVYASDVLEKDKIQDKIERLQRGDVTAVKQESTTPAMTSPDQIGDLKKELRKEQATSTESKRIETSPVNIMGDLDDVASDTGKSFDYKGEAKKRASK